MDKRLLTPKELRHLNEKWEEEYEDVPMTDAAWELKRGQLMCEAQLAKADRLDRPQKLCPRCGGEGYLKGKEITNPDIPTVQRVWESIDCPDCNGTGELDRPDRDKIAEFLAEYDSKCWLTMSLGLREGYKRNADKILSLIDPEAIKQDEKQKLLDYLDKVLQLFMFGNKDNEWHWALSDEIWQELKKGVPLTDRAGFLQPVIKEIKRQVAEGIFRETEEGMAKTLGWTRQGLLDSDLEMPEYWQALKSRYGGGE